MASDSKRRRTPAVTTSANAEGTGPLTPADELETLIHDVRGHKVMLDFDLARLYGVPTKALNQAVKRRLERFPEDFVFRVTVEEFAALRSQSATSNSEAGTANRSQSVTGSQRHRDPRFLPYAFTEHGAIMAANVLSSPRAVQMSVFVVRAFVRMRGMMVGTDELARKLSALERELTDRLDVHEAAIVEVLQRVMDILDPPPLPVQPSKRRIGFRP